MLDLIQNKNLIDFIKELKIKDNDKNFLISKVPKLDRERREALLKTLVKIKLLETEEEGVIKKMGEFWELVTKQNRASH